MGVLARWIVSFLTVVGVTLAGVSTQTSGGHADAYLWVKRPGDPDGSCGRGEPGPGHFMNQ